MAHLYCNGGNRFNYVSIRNYTQNNFGGGYSYGCSMPSFGGIFSNWGTGCGSLVGSFLGMLCRPNNTSGSNQGQGTTGNNGNDTDYKKINDLIEEINKDKNLINAQTKINSLTEELAALSDSNEFQVKIAADPEAYAQFVNTCN